MQGREVRDRVRPRIGKRSRHALAVAHVDLVDGRTVGHPVTAAAGEIIEHRDAMAVRNQAVAQMASYKAGAAGDEHVGRRQSVASITARMGTPRELTVGIGTRSYNATHSYAGLEPPGVRFVPALRLPLNRVRPGSLTALNTYLPLDPRIDLLHLMNGVVAAGWPTPWITSFESMLPRVEAGARGTRFERYLVRRLLSDRCRRLLAWSEQAVAWLDVMHPPGVAERLRAKTVVFTGSTGPPVAGPKRHELPLRVAFVGGHLIPKGGVALLRAAIRLRREGAPVQITVVGSAERLTDVTPPAESYRDEARELLQHVTHHDRLDPRETAALLDRSHVLVLPSLQETLGWVTLEAMQRAVVPVVAGIRTQRDLVGDGGIVLEVPVTPFGTWAGLDESDDRRARTAAATHEALTEQIHSTLIRLIAEPETYERLSGAALAEYRRRFDPVDAAARLRAIYDEALGAD
jgi:glycosyltransferase involved in cell wall biosynthesis